MPTLDRIEGFADELTAIRRDLHANPELGFQETRTSALLADRLRAGGLAAELLAAQIEGEPLPLEAALADALDPARFVLRARRAPRGPVAT